MAAFVGQGVFWPGTVQPGRHIGMKLNLQVSPIPVHGTAPGDLCNTGCAVDVLLRPDDLLHADASPVTAELLAKAFRRAEFLQTQRLSSSATPHHNPTIGERIGIWLAVAHGVD